MRKYMILFFALLLAFAAAAGAEEAETEPAREPELYDLWDSGESMTWISTAVPVSDGVLIVPASVLPEKQDQLVVSDGNKVWEAKAVLPDKSGLLATILFDAEKEELQKGFWPFLPYGESVSASACTVRFGDELGSRINRRVLSASFQTLQGNSCWLLSLSGSAAVGSPVLTQDGQLAGIIVAEYAEGENRYLSFSAEEIVRVLANVSDLLANLPGWGNPPEGFRITAEKNLVTIDWKDVRLPEKKEGESVWLVVMDAGNIYLSYFQAETEAKQIKLVLTPGRTYMAGITVSANAPDDIPQEYGVIFLPQAKRLTDYNFESKVCAVAEAPESGVSEGNPPVPVQEVTEELLRSGRAYFYSTSTYEVTEDISNKSLLITLTDPDGQNYRYESLWVYSPEYMKEDTWYVSLAESRLTAALDRKGYPKGIYRIAFYVDGDLADSVIFELK